VSLRRLTFLIALSAAALFLLVAAPQAFASEAAHTSFSWKTEGLKLLNFLIVVGILWYLLKDRVPALLRERRSKIEETIEEAKTAKAEAEAKRTEYEAKIAKAEQEIAGINAEGDRRIEEMKTELSQAAEAAAQRIASDTEERIASEVSRARSELQKEASLLAIELSEEIIKERLSKEDQKKLVDKTIEELEGLK
jgi:F-type H+-transporting ATPase subunit b